MRYKLIFALSWIMTAGTATAETASWPTAMGRR